jgi:hypothetical protein
MAYVPPHLRKQKQEGKMSTSGTEGQSLASSLATEAKRESARKEVPNCLLSVVAEYFSSQKLEPTDDLFKIYDDFFGEYSDVFSDDAEGARDSSKTGMPHHFVALHSMYLEKFSKTVEWVLSIHDGSSEQFYKECETVVRGKDLQGFNDSKHQWFVDSLMAALDFEAFHDAMKARKKMGAK